MKWRLPKLSKFFTAWSYSRLQGWRECPARTAYKHLHKLPEPSSEAASRGTLVHTDGEVFLKSKKGKPPASFQKFRTPLTKLRDMKAIAEVNWTMTVDWALTQWNDWDRAWVRMKVDAHVLLPKTNVVQVVDYKTGRVKPVEHEEQGKLYAVGSLVAYPNAKAAHVRFWYLDHGIMSPSMEYRRDALPGLKEYWEEQAAPMLRDRRFAPKPGMYCGWCPYSKAKGGPCKF